LAVQAAQAGVSLNALGRRPEALQRLTQLISRPTDSLFLRQEIMNELRRTLENMET
jgi:hypothetical protein